jgi:hypothetical protein
LAIEEEHSIVNLIERTLEGHPVAFLGD